MFDFHTSFSADDIDVEDLAPAANVFAPIDSSIDPLLFETVVINRVDLP